MAHCSAAPKAGVMRSGLISMPMRSLLLDESMSLESFQAKLATPFAVLGIRTVGELLTDIAYLPRGVATLAQRRHHIGQRQFPEVGA